MSAMLDFGSLQNGFGRLLRKSLVLIPKKITLPILQGKARGKLWKRESGNDGYWLGSYEAPKQKLFAESIREGDVVYDIGAQAGFYTMVASSCGAKTYAFEPEPRNYDWLVKHIVLNRVNAVPFNLAISDKDGVEKLAVRQSSTTHQFSSLSPTKPDLEIEVAVRTIDSLVKNGEIDPPSVIKIDVEGAQNKVMSGAINTLQKYHPVIFAEADEKDMDLLKNIGYVIEKISEGEYRAEFNKKGPATSSRDL